MGLNGFTGIGGGGDAQTYKGVDLDPDEDGILAASVLPTRVPLYGDGSDGAISRAADGNENGIIHATTYEVEADVTRTVSNGVLVIQATDSITIDGTLTATGTATTGGTGASGDTTAGQNGSSGADAHFVAGGAAGGDGGDGTQQNLGSEASHNGGSGGSGGSRTLSTAQVTLLRSFLSASYDNIMNLSALGGPSGGGGAAGGGAHDGDNSITAVGGDGGRGGKGGGVILLAAPTIIVNGTVEAAGTDGLDGTDGKAAIEVSKRIASGGGGGGGGGSGGVLVFVGSALTKSGTITTAPGTGGDAGNGGSNAHVTAQDGQPGADGQAGVVIEVVA